MVKVLAKGQIVIPKEIREKADIHVGDEVELQMTSKGIMVLSNKLQNGSPAHTIKLRELSSTKRLVNSDANYEPEKISKLNHPYGLGSGLRESWPESRGRSLRIAAPISSLR